MLHRDSVAIRPKNYLEHMNKPCGQNLEILRLKTGCIYIVIIGLMVCECFRIIMAYIQYLALFLTRFTYAVNRYICLWS
jgi:hypothetical protein